MSVTYKIVCWQQTICAERRPRTARTWLRVRRAPVVRLDGARFRTYMRGVVSPCLARRPSSIPIATCFSGSTHCSGRLTNGRRRWWRRFPRPHIHGRPRSVSTRRACAWSSRAWPWSRTRRPRRFRWRRSRRRGDGKHRHAEDREAKEDGTCRGAMRAVWEGHRSGLLSGSGLHSPRCRRWAPATLPTELNALPAFEFVPTRGEPGTERGRTTPPPTMRPSANAVTTAACDARTVRAHDTPHKPPVTSRQTRP